VSAILELLGISRRYDSVAGTVTAVDNLTLAIPKGSFFGLLGPSGCGKTTTLRMIAGFEHPDQGDIRLNGSSIIGLKPYQRRVNTVFQSYGLFPHLSVRANVEFGLRHVSATERSQRSKEALALVRMTGKEDRYPSQLSGGEKQRTALARSLVLQPEVLLLDEPLSALDARLRDQVRRELTQLQQQLGITFLLVTHDQEEALSLCGQIAILSHGKMMQCGTPQDLYLHPSSRFVADFLGKVNWLRFVNQEIGLRPEAIRLSLETPPDSSRCVQARVQQTVFLGNLVQVELWTDRGDLVLAETSRFEGTYTPGQAVCLSWLPADEIHVDAQPVSLAAELAQP